MRVINANQYDIDVYVDVVNFTPIGEGGQGRFQPVVPEENAGQTLAEWITPAVGELRVPAEQTVEIPFSITVPSEAPPGGHYAAVLVGTKSLSNDTGVTQVETSQVVTSLVFLRVTGEVIESGQIREFRATNFISERPEVSFELRFENKGNVHILPQGEIKVLNMWGQERGIIPVNRQTMFGNVLPESVRKYSFTWMGEWSLADMGRYTAIATLAYGDDERQFASSETSFWVVPWRIFGVVLLSLIAFVLFITWAIKLYIRRMLQLAGLTPHLQAATNTAAVSRQRVSVVAPLEEGMLDLRQRFRTSRSWTARAKALATFVTQYRLFFVAFVLVGGFIAALTWYINSASVSERAYEVVIDGVESDLTISSEQVEYEALREEGVTAVSDTASSTFPAIKIVNQSGISGLAATLRVELEAAGYPVTTLTTELDTSEQNTVIVYAPEFATEALALSKHINSSLLSAYAPASESPTPITVYVGEDYQNAVQYRD